MGERISTMLGSEGVTTEDTDPKEHAEKLWGVIQKKLAELSVYLEAHPEVELGLEDEKLNTLH